MYQLDSSHWFRDVVDLSNPANDSEKGRVIHLHHRPHLQPEARLRPLLSGRWRREVVEAVGGAWLVGGRGQGRGLWAGGREQSRFGCGEWRRSQSCFRTGGGRRLQGSSGRLQHRGLDQRMLGRRRGRLSGDRGRLRGCFTGDRQLRHFRERFGTRYSHRRPLRSTFCTKKTHYK